MSGGVEEQGRDTARWRGELEMLALGVLANQYANDGKGEEASLSLARRAIDLLDADDAALAQTDTPTDTPAE